MERGAGEARAGASRVKRGEGECRGGSEKRRDIFRLRGKEVQSNWFKRGKQSKEVSEGSVK